MDPDRAPIFVVGSGRSGTTLLRLMLSAHPRIYLTHEASFYLWEQTARRRPLEKFFESFSFRWLGLDTARVLAGLPSPVPLARRRDFYTAVMREKAAQYGKPRWGDKTPGHAFQLGKVFRDYPDARVVRIVRDPRATVQSLMRMPWSSGTVGLNARYCEGEQHKIEPFRDRVLEIRLEDLLADARTTMGRVLEFVGEPWDDAVLDHAAHRCDPRDMPPLPWFESAGRTRSTPAADGWQGLTPVQVRRVERRNRRTMEAMGYPVASLDAEPSRGSLAWSALREAPELLRSLAAIVRFGLALHRTPCYRDPRVERLFRRINPGAWHHYPGLCLPAPPPPRALPAGDAFGA